MRELGFLLLISCSADHYVEEGQKALERHELGAAESSFREALQKDPTHLDALEGIAWTYYLAGQRPAAITAFGRCRELAPERVGCIRGMASIAMGNNELPRARDLIALALSIAPEDPGVQSSQALLEVREGDVEGAEARYLALTQRFPEDAEYHLGLAEVLLRKGDSSRSLEVAEQALTLSETPVRYRARLNVLVARALVAESAGRVDPLHCEETAPPVLQWLDAADRSLERAKAMAVEPPDLAAAQRLVLRRRGVVEDKCPPSAVPLNVQGM